MTNNYARLVVIALIFAAGLSIACGNNSTPTAPTPVAPKVADAVTIPAQTDSMPSVSEFVPSFTMEGSGVAVPLGMDTKKYPILAKGYKLTQDDVIRMKLRLDVAPVGTVLWNYDPVHKAFWLDTLREERKVWKNQEGEIVYLENCSNRAMKPLPLEICPMPTIGNNQTAAAQPAFLDARNIWGWTPWSWWRRDTIVEIDKPNGEAVDVKLDDIHVVTKGSVAIRVYR